MLTQLAELGFFLALWMGLLLLTLAAGAAISSTLERRRMKRRYNQWLR